MVIDLAETGRQIGEKLFAVLTKDQKRGLIKYMSEVGLEKIECGQSSYDIALKEAEKPLTEIQVKDLYICLEQRMVKVRNQVINLTVKEFNLLALFMMHPKRVFTYEMLMDLVWNEDYTFYSRKAVNNHVSNLRKKIKIAPDIPDYVKSVYGVGYKFDV